MSTTTGTAGDAIGERYGAPATGTDGPWSPPEWNDVLATQLAHRSVRSYLPEPVADETIATLVAAAQSAPTSSNLQLWSVIAVRDPARKARIAELAGAQKHIVDAPVLLVWLADLARARRIAADHSGDTEGADYLESTVVAVVDAALAAQNALVAAESLGLGTCYIGAVRNNPLEVAAELGLPEGVFAVFGLLVGHPDPAVPAKVKPRLPQQAVLHRETYDLHGQTEHVLGYEERIRGFYDGVGLETSWMQRVATRFGSVAGLRGRDRLRQAMHQLGFPLR
jgi:nitroreductase